MGNRTQSAHRVSSHDALEYEFYLPNKIIRAKATKNFIDALEKYGKGALVFPGALGKWQQTRESIFIYRKIIIPNRSSATKVRRAIIRLLSAMNTALAAAQQQESVVFSERKIQWVMLHRNAKKERKA